MLKDSTLYNKYRPKIFLDVVGQDITVKLLQKQLDTQTLPHSLIFHGTFGTGKTSVARIIANTLNTSSTGLVEYDCTTEANVDFTRKLQNDVRSYALDGLIKTYIFDEAHNIPHKAFDGLLKTVEELPDHVYFIFVTSEFSKIPQGIKSRCADYRFIPINSKDLTLKVSTIAQKEGIHLSDYVMQCLVNKSNGSLRDALVDLQKLKVLLEITKEEDRLLFALNSVDPKIFSNIVKSCFDKNFYNLIEAIDDFTKSSIDPLNLILQFQKFIIDLRFNLSTDNLSGPTKETALYIKTNKLDSLENIKGGARYLDFLYDELVKVYMDLTVLPAVEQRLKRFSIEAIKNWK